MKKYLDILKSFLVVVTPAIATSILVTSPSQAASIAYSESRFNINNFSSSPLDVNTLTNTVTTAISTGGQVSANAQAEAKFNVDANNSASNWSLSQSQGQGYGYTGSANSLAGIIGYSFQVDKEFSFDFSGLFNLNTSIEDALTESANASGRLALQLYDNDTGNLLDYFNIYGNLSTLGDRDIFNLQSSSNISLDLSKTYVNSSFGGTQEYASTTFNGKYFRIFDQPTRLTLVQAKVNDTQVYSVPEASTTLGSLFGFIMLGAAWTQQKRKKASKGCVYGK
ncbi:MAG: hypothetical protein KME60_18905 [Cyanomargarita calcarea GSE-NOS-MK-12-04C]|jgi:hypothetical protein|uniref:PEP-CTERM protein-sorting domain-containing protein n=1 Tax=Cyanomargarita calcarea GSE-NOS-MK-12-04C TaxID=2839659 RepID=A0A951QP57_9CYAN|nr:hypothetical protein [Cyanomargarita calcarea GSE-NOS-MK-12-04C]